MEDDLKMFMEQIEEDIKLIQEDWADVDQNLKQDEYAFDFWILSRMFSIDDSLVLESITEYSDKAIDCFANYEDSKELYIIQNKFYKGGNPVVRSDVADFLKTPMAVLKDNAYSSKSEELQTAFNKAKDDAEYKIFLYFFTTYEGESDDIKKLISDTNKSDYGVKCYVEVKYFCLGDIYDSYYGKNYRQDIKFDHLLGTVNKGTFLSIREEYGIEEVYEAYYIVTPVTELYKMLIEAEKKDYMIFERNMRDYLGSNAINNGIISTLKSKTERRNFMYYNNGITLVCENIGGNFIKDSLRVIPISNPQIVNGCQTVSSIKKVLENFSENDMEEEYKNVYVMVKALVISDMDDERNKEFYNNVVKYTNRQNAITDKAFAANLFIFYRLQEEFRKRGFLLLVRPSDKNTYKTKLAKTEIASLINKANDTIKVTALPIVNDKELYIPLEKLLQIYLAFIKDGYFAFTKKSQVLKQDGEIFEEYSSQINNHLSIDNMIKLYWLYMKAEQDKKASEDKRTPIPYYVVGFLGSFIGEKSQSNIQKKLGYIFSEQSIFDETYRFLCRVTRGYRRLYELQYKDQDFQKMIKKPIEMEILYAAVDTVKDPSWEYIDNWFGWSIND